MSTQSLGKLDVMTRQARDINPELEIKGFAEGVTADNLDAFLDGVDLYIDGLDFFAFQARCQVFAACAQKRIPAVTAAPLGMGAAVLNFLPGGMCFEEYFRFGDGPEAEMPLRFLLSLAPARLQMRYLADPSTVDLAKGKGPSTVVACQLCAGVAARGLENFPRPQPRSRGPQGLSFRCVSQQTGADLATGGQSESFTTPRYRVGQTKAGPINERASPTHRRHNRARPLGTLRR